MILISLSNVLLTILLLTTLILTVKRVKSTIDFYYSDYLDIAKEKNIDKSAMGYLDKTLSYHLETAFYALLSSISLILIMINQGMLSI
ncbi:MULTISPECIES: hypothetical protein [Enterobacteriaceae]|uniref:Uncharacterized protein n=2 Tax=Enterobacteriaceae TaxID=543 RepID=A0A486V7I9_KLEPN|nr:MULTISPECIES: hypothetical protein [Enterobacteriaceae]EAN6850896.1 hypothetical protein [Salmonella enterica]EBH8147897.1 hypothetical protein [Salmonella enterica subsp. enterica serovar Paratyphi B str. SPB7]EBU9107115.1 hypothetical protein [Salmonella enterica subsp. enterica serovar Virchow]ECB7904211.1 hypothetical protein [Salmonella enterica subsp. enterica serovar Braenderup]ECC1580901.1 hypothetical protein [Salmonella enterica subsp. diarizonae]ECD1186985.1 hypothetical protein